MESAVMVRKSVGWLLRLGLGGLFIYAGVMKVRDPEQFFWDIHHYELTPWDLSMVLAFWLPWLEILAGAAIILRVLERGGIAICAVLSAVFLGAISSAWFRGLDITCGCFGKEENATNFAQHIWLNSGMLLTAAVLGWLTAKEQSSKARGERPDPNPES